VQSFLTPLQRFYRPLRHAGEHLHLYPINGPWREGIYGRKSLLFAALGLGCLHPRGGDCLTALSMTMAVMAGNDDTSWLLPHPCGDLARCRGVLRACGADWTRHER
jgi:hypothetical protein